MIDLISGSTRGEDSAAVGPAVDPAADTADEGRVRDVIVIGSGPAGYTAAIYLSRAELAPLVFEGSQFGGALMTTTEVENFPGFADGILGPDLMAQMRAQAEKFGADLRPQDVDGVDLTGDVKIVRVDGATYRARAVVLATGSAARYLGLPDEQRLIGHGVSACATCDGFFFRGQDVAVVGGGDSAMEEATFLTRFANSVTIVHRRDEFRASAIMLDRAKKDPKIRWATNSEVIGVNGDTTVTSLTLRDTVTGAERELAATGLFLAIGHDPRSELFLGQVPTDSEGYVLVEPHTTATAVTGVFACGDLVDHTYRQAITAAGTGCSAALDAQHYLAGLGELSAEADSTENAQVDGSRASVLDTVG